MIENNSRWTMIWSTTTKISTTRTIVNCQRMKWSSCCWVRIRKLTSSRRKSLNHRFGSDFVWFIFEVKFHHISKLSSVRVEREWEENDRTNQLVRCVCCLILKVSDPWIAELCRAAITRRQNSRRECVGELVSVESQARVTSLTPHREWVARSVLLVLFHSYLLAEHTAHNIYFFSSWWWFFNSTQFLLLLLGRRSFLLLPLILFVLAVLLFREQHTNIYISNSTFEQQQHYSLRRQVQSLTLYSVLVVHSCSCINRKLELLRCSVIAVQNFPYQYTTWSLPQLDIRSICSPAWTTRRATVIRLRWSRRC